MQKKVLIAFLAVLVALSFLACENDPELVGPPLEGEVTDLADQFIRLLREGDYSSAVRYFNADMLKSMPEQTLEKAWLDLLSQMGPNERNVEHHLEELGDYITVNRITEFDNGIVNIRVVFDPDQRIGGLWFRPVN